MPPAPSNHVDNVKSYDYDIETLPDPCSTWCKLSETPRITNKVLVLHLYIVSITFLDTYPSPFLSISLNSFSIGVSSPRNSSTVSRPSKSRSKAAKKWSTLSLILRDHWSVCMYVTYCYVENVEFRMSTDWPGDWHPGALQHPEPLLLAELAVTIPVGQGEQFLHLVRILLKYRDCRSPPACAPPSPWGWRCRTSGHLRSWRRCWAQWPPEEAPLCR